MAITITEMPASQEGTATATTLHYRAKGSPDGIAIRAALLAYAPAAYDDLIRVSKEVNIDPVFVDTVNGVGTWDCRVPYKVPEFIRPETGDSAYTFDTGGGTQHITTALNGSDGQVGYAPPGAFAVPDLQGAINATEDSVDGVDIVVPDFRFSETHYLPLSQVTTAYKMALKRLSGKINAAPFRGHGTGEVLFINAAGSQRGEDDWEIAFNFTASEDEVGIVVGKIIVDEKPGHSYLWAQHGPAEDDSANKLIMVPKFAFVAEVYEYDNFADLGIGTAA